MKLSMITFVLLAICSDQARALSPAALRIPRILVKDDVVSTPEDTTVIIPLLAEGREESYLCEATAAAHGEFSLSGCELTYTPGENSTESESLTYVAIDSKGKKSKSASIWITVDPVNDAPTAVSLDLSTDENTSVSVALSGMDVERSALTYSLGTPSNGTLTGTPPALVYVPSTNFSGTDSFTYSVSDGQTDSTPATVTVQVIDTVADSYATSDVTYCTHADGTEMKLDIYPAASGEGRRPLVMLVHGGGFVRGSKSADDTLRPKEDFVARGLTVVAVDYRFSFETDLEGMLQDLRCATRFLRANAALYNIDPDRFGIMGSSAGGYLANCVAMGIGNDGGDYLELNADQNSGFQALVDWYGATDITYVFDGFPEPVRQALLGSQYPASDVLIANSPAYQVTASSPPALIQNGMEDVVIPFEQAQTLYDAYVTAGADAELHLYENAVHGFAPEDASLPYTDLDTIIDTAGDWFEKMLVP